MDYRCAHVAQGKSESMEWTHNIQCQGPTVTAASLPEAGRRHLSSDEEKPILASSATMRSVTPAFSAALATSSSIRDWTCSFLFRRPALPSFFLNPAWT